MGSLEFRGLQHRGLLVFKGRDAEAMVKNHTEVAMVNG